MIKNNLTFETEGSGETKICQFTIALRVQQDVARLLITVYHISRMQKLCGLNNKVIVYFGSELLYPLSTRTSETDSYYI